MIIYKYELASYGITTLSVPVDAKILKVGLQQNTIIIWFLVDELKQTEMRTFNSMYTGDNIYQQKIKHIDTVINDTTDIVTHVFEETSDAKYYQW